MIRAMILLCAYQYFHRIHCHSTSIAMNYTTSGAKCWFGCRGWCWNTQNISCYSYKNQILFTYFFTNSKYQKSNVLFHWRIISPYGYHYQAPNIWVSARNDSGRGAGLKASSLGPCWAYCMLSPLAAFVTILTQRDTCRDLDERQNLTTTFT